MKINEDIYPLVRSIGNTEITNTVTEVSPDGEMIEKSIFYAGCNNEYLNRYDGVNCTEYFNGGTGFTVQLHPQTEFTKSNLVAGYNTYWGSAIYNRSTYQPNSYHGEDLNLVRRFNFADVYIDLDDGLFVTCSLEKANTIVPYDSRNPAYESDKKSYTISDYINNERYNNGEPIIGFTNIKMVQTGTTQRYTVAMCHDNIEAESTNYSTFAINDGFRLTTFANNNMVANQWNHFTCIEGNWNNSGQGRCMLHKAPPNTQYPIRFGSFIFGNVSECEIDVLATREYHQGRNYYIPHDYDFSDHPLPIIVYGTANWAFELVFGYSFEYFKRIIASLGIRFKLNNIMYVPEIDTNGYTTGRYTAETNLPFSDFANKNWQTTEDSSYDKDFDPDTPEESIDFDEQKLSVYGHANQFMKYYWLNETDVGDLHNDILSKVLSKPMDYVVSLAAIPDVLFESLNHSESKHNIVLGTDTMENAKGYRIYSSKCRYTLGEHHISRLNDNFLDYSPYMNVSIYIPYVGNIELPTDVVMGNTITIEMIFDFETGDCEALIFCRGGMVASGSGSITKTFTLSTDNFNFKMISSGVGLLGAAVGATMVPGLGLLPALGATGMLVNALGKNMIDIKSGCNNALNFKKPQYPCIFYNYSKPIKNENYGRSIGYACNKYGKLSDFEGYTECVNPHIEIVATEREKERLHQKLINGVILPYKNDI